MTFNELYCRHHHRHHHQNRFVYLMEEHEWFAEIININTKNSAISRVILETVSKTKSGRWMIQYALRAHATMYEIMQFYFIKTSKSTQKLNLEMEIFAKAYNFLAGCDKSKN